MLHQSPGQEGIVIEIPQQKMHVDMDFVICFYVCLDATKEGWRMISKEHMDAGAGGVMPAGPYHGNPITPREQLSRFIRVYRVNFWNC